MILPNVAIPELANKVFAEYGLDNVAKFSNKDIFNTYQYPVNYQYNSRGFRDAEWPDSLQDLRDSVWCIGDSFTAGIASAYTHIWPVILQNTISKRCINVSMDGASNQWMARKTLDILNEVSPQTIIVHWSYFHRCEKDSAKLTDMQRRLHYAKCAVSGTEADLLNIFGNLIRTIEQYKGSTKLIHTFIPQGPAVYDSITAGRRWQAIAGDSWPPLPITLSLFNALPADIKQELVKFNEYNRFKNFSEFGNRYDELLSSVVSVSELEQVDFARDKHHYDIITASNFVEKLITVMNMPET